MTIVLIFSNAGQIETSALLYFKGRYGRFSGFHGSVIQHMALLLKAVLHYWKIEILYFLGLIFDLFPALDVPRKQDQEFEKTVKQAANDMLLQPEDNFILKVVQLEELLEVRHSVFIVGNAGTGKTQVWKTLFESYKNDNKKPIYNDLK